MTKPFAPTTKHGTTNAYTNYGCRCDECKRAMRDKLANYRRRQKDGLITARMVQPSNRALKMMAEWIRVNQPDVYMDIMRRTHVRHGL